MKFRVYYTPFCIILFGCPTLLKIKVNNLLSLLDNLVDLCVGKTKIHKCKLDLKVSLLVFTTAFFTKTYEIDYHVSTTFCVYHDFFCFGCNIKWQDRSDTVMKTNIAILRVNSHRVATLIFIYIFSWSDLI
ncbi:hypothetical protein Hanom_Chr04g00354941 [Helianthus anomalus]